jgi:predicted deacetylase
LSAWLDRLRAALDRARAPVVFFFRDDDAGWADEQLNALLDLFCAHGMPIDLAVIPQALTPPVADALLKRHERRNSALGLHQHGYAHVNHELAGRKCEFGPSRNATEQLDDLAAGQRQLYVLLGASVDPIFTPPWNRCTQDTAQCLRALGFQTLSRNRGAAPLKLAPMSELNVALDWQKRPQDAPPGALGAWLAYAASQPEPVGVMLHHAAMQAFDFSLLAELLVLLGEHKGAGCRLMRAVHSITPAAARLCAGASAAG